MPTRWSKVETVEIINDLSRKTTTEIDDDSQAALAKREAALLGAEKRVAEAKAAAIAALG